ncbi:MAG TPA: phospholipase D-like domain-containing protein [Tepidisphaeraceae bacterium]
MQETTQPQVVGKSRGVNVATDPDGWMSPPPTKLADGNSVHLLKDGEALYAAYQAIAAAKRGVCLETFIFHSDDTGRAFAELLSKRAKDGLDVRVIYDSFGCFHTDPKMFAAMRAAGVRIREFHPVLPWQCRHGWRIFNRDHRKLVIVDDEIGFLGGQNLGDEYGGSWISGKANADAWRDTGVACRGASVRLLCEAFSRVWSYIETGGPIDRAEIFHTRQSLREDPRGSLLDDEPAGRVAQPRHVDARASVLETLDDPFAVLASVPTPRSRLVASLHRLLRDAKSSIELTMAYFAPPEELADQLCRSARQGVRVRMMLPGRSNHASVLIAGRAFYKMLLQAGVEIYERQHAMLHAKTLCVDGKISIIGSTNLDYRSIQFNCELSAVIHSQTLGEQMHDLFEHDVRFARQILPEQWRHESLRDRLVQWMVMRARYLL